MTGRSGSDRDAEATAAAEPATPTIGAATTGAATIGAATMQADGTLVLQLRAEAEDGTVGDVVLTYRVGDARYEAVRAHLGPLGPGESCLVLPWPQG